MQKYFIDYESFNNKTISNDDAFHIINVMRSRIGDEILLGVDGKTYLAKITSLSNKIVNFEIIDEKTGKHEMPAFVTIFQGYPKGDKLEDIIKHGTELGAYSFMPVITKRSIVKIEEKKIESKLIRLNKIAKEAAEQSFRDIVPSVIDIKKLKDIDFKEFDYKILCYEEKASDLSSNFKNIIKNIKENDKIAVFIGPEGGMDETEVKYLEELGFIACGLGPRILRTETAAFYVLSSISYEMELK